MEDEGMSDEPGSPSADASGAALMLKMIAAMDPLSADGRAGLGAVLREIEAAYPGALERLRVGLAVRKVRSGRVTVQ